MTDTLSESFCERCGTRYEFAAAARIGPLRRTRGLLSGLKTYLTTQEALSDAVGDAMRGEADGIAATQLTAFHDTFSFCLSCRQYACNSCWNTDAGRCRSCEPMPGQNDVAPALKDGHPAEAMVAPEVTPEDRQAWPVADLVTPQQPAVEPEAAPEPEPEPVVAPMSVDEIELRLAWLTADQAPQEPETPDVSAEVDEPQPITLEVEVAPTAIPEPEPEPEPEPVAVASEPERPELAAHRAKLDLLGIGTSDAAAATQQPRVLPYRSRGAGAHPGEAPRAVASVWDASAREVSQASGVSIRECGNCALSLSVSARFCRRCGTPQARSA